MEVGTLQRIINLFKTALTGLHAEISLMKLESLGIMVHKAMTAQARTFHTPEHIFDLMDETMPILALAALFHDVVYYQVDDGFIPEIGVVLAPYVHEEGGQLSILAKPVEEDLMLALTLEIFGFEPGKALIAPPAGLNEFLSALLMNKQLEGVVSLRDLLEVTSCIEATIPFRGENERGQTPADILYCRLTTINARHELGMAAAEIEQTVKWSVMFSNKDVENFSVVETGEFLDNTWKLLPETNPSLRLRAVYSIKSYRIALQKMEGFLRVLNPENIFNQYRGVPPEGDYQRMLALAYRNVATGREYLGIKLLTAAILEALADITGGDAPVALFTGDVEGDENCRSLEDFLPRTPLPATVNTESTLFGLLAFGRASTTSFDMQNSPLSLFVYKQLDPYGVQELLSAAHDMFEGLCTPEAFLEKVPSFTIAAIAEACAVMAVTRSDALCDYAVSRSSQ